MFDNFCSRPLKKFIKAVCCYPERCTQEDYDAAMPGFQESEKVRDSRNFLEGNSLC